MGPQKGLSVVAATFLILTTVPWARSDGPEGLSLDRLAHMSPCELEQLYRAAPTGPVPDGYCRGRAIYCPDAFLAGPRAKATNFLWRGKHFGAADGTLVNQWRGVRAIQARVYEGPSSLDGKPAIILDYQGTSRVWNDVRDEVREVGPGVYLGLMYRRRCSGPRFQMFFALEAAAEPACPAHAAGH